MPSQISLAWMLNKKSWIVPIPGARHSDCLRENICAAEIRLTPEQVKPIDADERSIRRPAGCPTVFCFLSPGTGREPG